jgi:outer membrane protein assembly factor BamB
MRNRSVLLVFLGIFAGCNSGSGAPHEHDSGSNAAAAEDAATAADAPGAESVRDEAADTLSVDGVADGVEGARDIALEAGKPDVTGGGDATGHASVLQHHNNASRDGFYVDPALSRAAIAKLHMDPAFAGATLSGPTYAQPLYLAGANGAPDLVIVATEQNHVYAFDASQGGKPIWDRLLGMPLPRSRLATLRAGCGNIDPLGVTGTPIIDGATRTIYVDAMLIANANATAQHQVFALDADSGAVKPGWPVDLNSKATAAGISFDSLVQNQRGALALLDGKVFVPFGGHIGDCSTYHGWIVGISTTDPTQVSAWVTRALAGGVWAPGGISSDGRSLFFATGNTENQANTFTAPPGWQDGETIFRLPSSLVASGQNADYFTPTNWAALDNADTDLGGTAPLVFNVPGATPSALLVGLGKDGNAYLLDRANLGGISTPLVLASVSSGAIITAAAAYSTPQASYVVFKGAGRGCPSGQSGGLAAFKISAASPPAVTMAWCAGPATQTSPAVSATDAQGTDAVVWVVGGDNKLYGLDGDTGKSIFAGGSSSDTMSSVQKFIPPIVANGRVFVAANNQVYAFTP